MKVRKSNSILVPWKSWFYLQNRCHEERSESRKPLNMERYKRMFDQHAYNGFKQLKDGDLGGCVGNPKKAFEQGRWTSWTCEDMKRILTEAGLPYKDGGKVEYISVSL